MYKKFLRGKLGLSSLAAIFLVPTLWAAQIPVGYLSWDVNFPANAGQFDITNLTGPNALPPTFPITSTVNLSGLVLKVNFSNGTSVTEPAGYFTLSSDGESFDGTSIPIGGTNPQPVSATLTGIFSPTSISEPGPDSILSTFTVSISPDPGNTFLVDGDLGIINATEGTGSGVPEPGSWTLLLIGVIGSAFLVRRQYSSEAKRV